MKSRLPPYYTALKPFGGLFAEGTPLLMYHKVGPRPAGVKLKGLYVSPRLFARQMAELREAGFNTPVYGLPADRAGNPARRILLTFDDGFANVLRHAVEPLARNGFRAIQFIVADRIGGFNEWDLPCGEAREPLMDAAQIREWLAAGHEIGSHTLTHARLTQVGAAQAREEIFSSKKKLEDLFGVPVRHFCYPYGDWNPAVRGLLLEAGYETACNTEFGVNTAATPPFELKRITARYRSISLKSMASRLALFQIG